MGGIISWTLPLLWLWCLALTLTPYVLAIALGSWLLLFLPPLSSFYATFPWSLLLLFFFFWGSFEFPSIDVCLTLQILLQVHKVSFVDVATLSICKHRSSCYIYKDDSVSAPAQYPLCFFPSIIVLPHSCPSPTVSMQKTKTQFWDKPVNGTRAAMAWPLPRPMPLFPKQRIYNTECI